MKEKVQERLLDIPTHNSDNLSYDQVRFIDEYMICGNKREAYRRVHPEATEVQVTNCVYRIWHSPLVVAEIERRRAEMSKASIMDAQEIMEMYTKIARGEVQDQFGLDASLRDRISAIKELSKLQMDLSAQNKESDNKLEIKITR